MHQSNNQGPGAPNATQQAYSGQQSEDYQEIIVKVKRCCKVVKGGKRFSFSALVVVGNRNGRVGYGHGKAQEVPFAVQKASKHARKHLVTIPIVNTTIPYSITAKYGATRVVLKPACKGTGVIAGSAVKAVVELAGIKNILSKVFGSTNAYNTVKATFIGLQNLKFKRNIESIRGVRIA